MEPGQLIDKKQLEEMEKKLKESRDKLEKLVHEYPLATLAIAVGVGYLLARLLNKERR